MYSLDIPLYNTRPAWYTQNPKPPGRIDVHKHNIHFHIHIYFCIFELFVPIYLNKRRTIELRPIDALSPLAVDVAALHHETLDDSVEGILFVRQNLAVGAFLVACNDTPSSKP